MSTNTIENPPKISQIRDSGVWLLKVDGHQWPNQKQGRRRVLDAWIEPSGKVLYILFDEESGSPNIRKERFECYVFDLDTDIETTIPPEELSDRVSSGAISLKEYDAKTKFRSLTIDFDNDTEADIQAYRQRIQPKDHYLETVGRWLVDAP